MKAYSSDVRLKILAAVNADMSKSQAARTFRAGLSTVKRYVRQRRDTGRIAPRTAPGTSPRIPPSQYPALIAQLTAHPSITLDEHCALWKEASGVRVSNPTMSRKQRRVEWTRKKDRNRQRARRGASCCLVGAGFRARSGAVRGRG